MRTIAVVLLLASCGCSTALDRVAATSCSEERDNGRRCCSVWERAAGGSCIPRSWSRATTLGGPSGEARVALDATGRALVAFLESPRPLSGDVKIATELEDGSWSVQPASGGLQGRAQELRIATGRDRAATVCWRQVEGESGRIYASLRNGDGDWSHPGPNDSLSFPPNAYEPELAYDGNGEATLVWNQATQTGLGVAVARRARGSDRFLGPANAEDVVSPPIHFTNSPDVAVNPQGDAVISWYQSTRGALNVFAAERREPGLPFSRPGRNDRLSFDDPRPEGASGRFLDASVPAIDAVGRAAVAWTQPVDESAVAVYLATRDPKGVWAIPGSIEESFSARSGQAWYPRLAVGEVNDLYMVWRHESRGVSEIRLAYRDSKGRWLAPGDDPLVLSAPGAQAGLPAIAGGRAGAVIVAWSERSPEGGFRLVLRLGSTPRAGGPILDGWSPGTVLAEGPDRIHSISIAAGGPGNRAVISWIQAGSTHVSSLM